MNNTTEEIKCPECGEELQQIIEDDTSAVIVAYCENCNYEEKY